SLLSSWGSSPLTLGRSGLEVQFRSSGHRRVVRAELRPSAFLDRLDPGTHFGTPVALVSAERHVRDRSRAGVCPHPAHRHGQEPGDFGGFHQAVVVVNTRLLRGGDVVGWEDRESRTQEAPGLPRGRDRGVEKLSMYGAFTPRSALVAERA